MSGRQRPLPNHILDGTHQPYLVPAGLQNGFQHIGYRAFPIGPRNAHQLEPFRRASKPIGAHLGPDRTGGGYQQLVFASGILLRHDHGGAVLLRLTGEAMPVCGGSADADEGPAQAHPAGIAGNSLDLGIKGGNGNIRISSVSFIVGSFPS